MQRGCRRAPPFIPRRHARRRRRGGHMITYEINLICDRCDEIICSEPLEDASVMTIIELAQTHGWVMTSGRILCRECRHEANENKHHDG